MTSLSNARARTRSHVVLRATVGAGAQVWDQTVVRAGAHVGADAIVGREVCVGPRARWGERGTVPNQAPVREPAVLGDGVLIGPAVVLTNDTCPPAATSHGRCRDAVDRRPVGVTIEEGAAVGARAVCVTPDRWVCPVSGEVYVVIDGRLEEAR